MSRPSSISIFLFDGDPNGIRVANIAMSTIQAIAFRRNQLRQVRKNFPDIERPGVYILIGGDESERRLVYIGESEGVGTRLSDQNSRRAGSDSKDFWVDTVALISKDESLTKSHVRYVESCLIPSVSMNPRWDMPNKNTPSDDAGKLPLPDRAAMDEFVDQAKMLVGTLGWDMFREVRGRTQEEYPANSDEELLEVMNSPTFSFNGKEYAADMIVSTSGEFVVLAGSKAKVEEAPSLPSGSSSLRDMLLETGVLRREGNRLLFTSDYRFSSASAAAETVCGSSASGRLRWKLPDGSTYADWEAGLEEDQD